MTEFIYNNKLLELFQKTQSICRNISFQDYVFQGIEMSPFVWKVEFELNNNKYKIYLFADEVKQNYDDLRSIIIDKIIYDRIKIY